MNVSENAEELEKIRLALCEGAEQIDGDNLADVMRGCALVIEETDPASQLSLMDSLRMMAAALEPWAPAPGKGLTIAVATLRMAADHVELGATLATGTIIAENINGYIRHIKGL